MVLVLLVLIALIGCNDENNPKFTRLRVYPDCGVLPLSVDCLAIVSGGNESGDPTGGNNNMDITWDFGDGTSSNTSISYHTYADSAGTFTVTATAVDPDGKTTKLSHMVRVMPDTLEIHALSDFDELQATVCDSIRFDVLASSCGIDPLVDDNYRNLVFEWRMNDGTDSVFRSRRPVYSFAEPGDYEVTLSVSYPALATTRPDTVNLTVEWDPTLTVPTLVALPTFTMGATTILEWSDESANGTLEYVAECAEDSLFTDNVISSGETPLLTWVFAGLDDSQTYYYRVRSVGCPNNLEWSTIESSTQDLNAPNSAAGPLDPTQDSLAFDVPFSATDSASGVASVELFFQVDGGGYSSFGVFTASPVSFTAAGDGAYDFYTQATDNVGHIESAPSSPDASTVVVEVP